MSTVPIIGIVEKAVTARHHLFDEPHRSAIRLFNGFLEGFPYLVVDLYGATILLHNYADPPEQGQEAIDSTQRYLRERLPWVRAFILKTRTATSPEERHGKLIQGSTVDRRVREHGVWY